ncbi:MAG: hypothetical protein MUE40_06160 [Anaerolineae bacterium]|jgi:hypothetical protein|nr:hypothetical protein [Anaerolineae bacterium]
MHLVVLTGLVSIEKRDLALALAQSCLADGHRVALIDNIARLPVDPELTAGATLLRLQGDVTQYLATTLEHVAADVVILAASETAHPEALFSALAALAEARPGLRVRTAALIDLRTCDCFPNVRQVLERYADVIVNLPCDVAGVREALL